MEKINIYFVISHPIQYYVPLYKHLSKNELLNIKVIFLSDETIKGGIDKQFGVKFTWDIPLLEGYDYSFVKNISRKPSIHNGFWGIFNPGIILKLWKMPKGLVVISGWHFSSYWLCYFFAFLFGHRVAVRCEAPAYKEHHRKGIKNGIRKILIGKILLNGLVDKCLYIGQQNKSFYKHFLVPEEKLIYSPYSIDNDRFKRSIECYDKIEQRKLLGIHEEDFVILFTGKFSAVKRPLDLVKAYHQLDAKHKRLVLVGDGNLKEEIASYIAQHKVEGVLFTGFINQTELPKYYVLADVLVLCSESETWGLSVNEAMACGLPVIVSNSVGCAQDLVHNGRNGHVFPKGNVRSLMMALQSMAKDHDGNAKMAQESHKIINEFNIERSAEGIVRAAIELSRLK